MTPEQYAVLQAAISAAAASYAAQFAALFVAPAISAVEWIRLLQLTYPTVQTFRERSAVLAREFYDSQRSEFHPELPRHDRALETYEFEWFVENMEPVRKKFTAPNAPQSVVAQFSLQFVKEVENAGRKQIIHAVEDDDVVEEKVKKEKKQKSPFLRKSGKRPVLGWARVATGRETCAFCLALISREPVYKSAKTGGSKFDNETTVAAIKEGVPPDEWMREWHRGCDCMVVPVYDLENWVGKEAQERALELWNDATDDADEFIEANPGRVHKTGKKKGQPYTYNEEVMLALRRKLDSGAISSQEWAALQAA